MKQQVLIIHGGTTFSSYKKYIDSMKAVVLEPKKLKSRLDWKDSITADLGDAYEVLVPRMPNGSNAQYKEWSIWFEHIVPLLKNDTILVGNSLGGTFLAKCLSEKIVPIKIKAAILISAQYEELESEELASFALSESLSKFNKQAKNIVLIHSKDDEAVPFDHVYKYNKDLSNSNIILFNDKGHFKQEHFPELVELIKNTVG